MRDGPPTRESLLIRIADATDHEAWQHFSLTYEPVIYRLARKKGLQDADAHDVVQRVMTAVSKSIDRWQPDSDRASFRTWLYRVTNNALVDLIRKRRPDAGQGGTTVLRILECQSNQPFDLATWEAEHRREVFRWAARRIRKEFTDVTWSAFMLTSVDNVPPKDAAKRLGVTLGSVYTARSRIMKRLKEEVNNYG